MTEWFKYDNGKGFRCPLCAKEVIADERRWWNRTTKAVICNNCYDERNPGIPLRTPSSPPSIALRANEVSERNTAIAKAHEDNMLSYELTRICVTKQTEALDKVRASLDALVACMNARTKILEEQLKGG
jgi:hypothetical protein